MKHFYNYHLFNIKYYTPKKIMITQKLALNVSSHISVEDLSIEIIYLIKKMSCIIHRVGI